MLTIILVIPAVLLIVLTKATKSPWRLAAMLLVLGPLVGDFLVFVGTIALKNAGSISSLSAFASGLLMYYLLVLRSSIYPWGAAVAVLALLASLIFGRYCAAIAIRRAYKLLVGAVFGAAVGLIFGYLIFVAYKSPQFVDFVAHGDITERDPPPVYFPVSVVTGLLDGLLIAFYGDGLTKPR